MSLSKSTIDIVKATAPIVAKNSEAITSKMYDNLFENYPETKELFSNTSADQHKKLAGAVSAYAANIDNLAVLSSAVEKMVSTHVSANVKPEHYPMVGESILQAIKEVLGDMASENIINAWKEAYFFLADILIEAEKKAYALK